MEYMGGPTKPFNKNDDKEEVVKQEESSTTDNTDNVERTASSKFQEIKSETTEKKLVNKNVKVNDQVSLSKEPSLFEQIENNINELVKNDLTNVFNLIHLKRELTYYEESYPISSFFIKMFYIGDIGNGYAEFENHYEKLSNKNDFNILLKSYDHQEGYVENLKLPVTENEPELTYTGKIFNGMLHGYGKLSYCQDGKYVEKEGNIEYGKFDGIIKITKKTIDNENKYKPFKIPYSIDSLTEKIRNLKESSQVELSWALYEDGQEIKGLELEYGWYFGPEKDGQPIDEGIIVYKNGTEGTATFDDDDKLSKLTRNISKNETEIVTILQDTSVAQDYKPYLPDDYTQEKGKIDKNGQLNHFGKIEKHGVTIKGNFKVLNGTEVLHGYGSRRFHVKGTDGETYHEKGYFENDILIRGKRILFDDTKIETLYTGLRGNEAGSFGPNGWNGMIKITNKSTEESGNYLNGLRHGVFLIIKLVPIRAVENVRYDRGEFVEKIDI